MTVRIGIAENPFQPETWTSHDAEDTLAFLKDRFGMWPASARIYDLEGFGDWTRAAAVADGTVLASRDVTPINEAGIERLAGLRGPLLVTVPPADPLTVGLIIGAVVLGVAAAFLLIPKIPSIANQQTASPNNELSARSNKPRPNSRIPDILGTVRSVPDLLAVPYTIFEENREIEIAYMCVGRGAYSITDVRDGDTMIQSIAGAGVTIYGPYSSPNSGGAPQQVIGTVIDDPILTISKLNEVNGQTLRPPNSNFLRGANNIRFVAPDTIERTGDIDFTDYFDTDDVLTVEGAGFSGAQYLDASAQNARFYPTRKIEFQTFDPSTVYAAGQQIVLQNAGFAGSDGAGGVIYVDVSGTYVIDSVTSTYIQLVTT